MRRAIRGAGVYYTDTDDVFHDVFLRLTENGFRRLRQWQGQSSLATYLAVVARNAGRDWLRARPLTEPLDDEDDTPTDPSDPPRPLPEEIHLGQVATLVHRCLKALSERDRSLIGLRHLQDRAYAEIGQILSMTVNHVGVALSRAEARLRECLARLAPELFSENAWEDGPA